MRVIVVASLLTLSACESAQKSTEITIGTRLNSVIVWDFRTGRCVDLDGIGKYNDFIVVDDLLCQFPKDRK
jgi:hypothetical protein